MIARAWHGAVRAKDAEAYHAYIEATGLADYRRTPGNRAVYVLRRTDGEVAHFLLLTLWESWDAIRAFAGDEPERARYYPEDERYLVELEPTVTHYEVLEAVPSP
jgi:heme-degrading monooxygenase HmoA